MSFIISPLKGVGPIHFGMTQQKVRECLKGEYRSFKRTPSAEMPCDYFTSLAIFVYYKLSGTVEAVEFASPACLELEGKNLLAIPQNHLREHLYHHDPSLEVEPDALTSYNLGIAIYAPDEDINQPVESVIVFEKGYYD